jgi:ABC-type transporter Mla subunit MlaD
MDCHTQRIRGNLGSMMVTILIIGLLVLAVLCLSSQAGYAAGSSAGVTVTARITSAVHISDGGVVQSNTMVVRQVADGLVTYVVP